MQDRQPQKPQETTPGEAVATKGAPRRGAQLDDRQRKDFGQSHRVQHGILSREVLGTLTQLGENPKTYRRLERQFRKALQPKGTFGRLFFDRFWSSYLRLMLIARLEARLLRPRLAKKRNSLASVSLVPDNLPTLILPDGDDQASEDDSALTELPAELLRQLVLAQRYDRHHSREMYRCLAVLFLLRRGGEELLESWASAMLRGESAQSRMEN